MRFSDWGKGVIFLAVFSLLLPYSIGVFAADFKWKGEVETSLSYTFAKEETELSEAGGQLKLELEIEPDMDASGYVSLKAVKDFTDSNSSTSLSIDEAYLNLYLEDVDTRLGLQEISWGTGLGFNPTDNINPPDLKGFPREYEKLPVWAMKLDYYFDDWEVTGVYIPAFVPAEIPPEMMGDFPAPPPPPGMTIVVDPLVEQLPEMTLDNAEYAFKIATSIPRVDMSLSYFKGREDSPQIWIEQTQDPEDPTIIHLIPHAVYPWIDVIGADAIASVPIDFIKEDEEIGVWLEMAYFIPEELEELTDPQNEPYLQGIVGADYTFEDGPYTALQYMYRGEGAKEGLDNKPLRQANILAGELSLDWEDDWSSDMSLIWNMDDGSGAILPRIDYRAATSTEISLGFAFFLGEEDSQFGQLDNQISLGMKESF